MKSRDHVNQMKEKLIFCFWRKINETNKDLSASNSNQIDSGSAKDEERDSQDNETGDSSSNYNNNTPKSKNLKLRESSQSVDQSGIQIG